MKFLDKLEEYVLIITFPLMVAITIAGTSVRYFQLGTLTWSEEAARYLMIVAAFAGISLGFKENSHLGLSFFVEHTKGATQKLLVLVRTILIIIFGAITSYYAYIMINTLYYKHQVSPAMLIPMWIIYLPMLGGFILLTIRSIQAAMKATATRQEVL